MAQIDLKVSEKTKLETTVQLKSKSIDDCKQQIAKIDRKLKQIEAFSSQ